MPVVLEPTLPPPPPMPPRKRWTREEVEFYENSGAWDGKHYELVDGELINKMGKHLPHTLGVKAAVEALARIFGTGLVLQETSIDVSPEDHPTSNPEPDVIVLRRDPRTISAKEPNSTDILLVVEVADSTLENDLSVKAVLYARAGIPEYLVSDLKGRRLIVHREPLNGVYQSIVSYSSGERVAPLEAAGDVLEVSELFG